MVSKRAHKELNPKLGEEFISLYEVLVNEGSDNVF